MNHLPDISTGRSPRRELQGPRPTPLRIHKDSHKISKKPPLPPPQQQQQQPPRQPIIIYTVSPKVIHTTPGDFMNLVQRLTGSTSSSSSNIDPFNGDGTISPAARYATVEKAMSPLGKKQVQQRVVPITSTNHDVIMNDVHELEQVQLMNHGILERGNMMFQGILSPGPASLSPIPSNFFSPPSSDPNMVNNFLHDFSPVLHSSRNFMEGGANFFLPSPSNFVSPHTPTIDLFNYFLD
ncbi:protein MKS1 [Cicer arietinum]|uniref:Protein MKS1 n=1 Tax=Cicer arietinum TaxID=3827 RepID=A0A1S2YDJ0_CICAR|nr:protein MKS1 [Cicer arietinum]